MSNGTDKAAQRQTDSRTGLPPAWCLCLMILLPLAAHHYPEIFDWRFAVLVALSAVAGGLLTSWLAGLSSASHTQAPLYARPWFAVWAGYAVALAAPSLLFQAFLGRGASPPPWTPLWPGGDFTLGLPVVDFTDALLLASVPAVLVALLGPGRKHRETAPAEPRDEDDACRCVPANGLAWAALRGAAPLAIFIAAAFALSLRIPHGQLLGDRIDVMLNVWNHWWFQKALADPGLAILHTDYVYYPHGVSLLWHTLGIPNSLIGMAYQAVSGADSVGVYNFVALTSFALMGWAGYLLGRRIGPAPVGFFAGFAIMLCGAHLGQVSEGHLGLSSAQWVIFFFLFMQRAFERGRTIDAVAAGVFWTAAFYTHFYHAIFCGIIFGIMAAGTIAERARRSPRVQEAGGWVRSVLGRRVALPLLLTTCALVFWGSGHWRLWVMAACIVALVASSRAIAGKFKPRGWWRPGIAPMIFAALSGPWLIAMFLQNVEHAGFLDWGRHASSFSIDVLGYLTPSPASRGSSLFEFVWGRRPMPSGDLAAFVGAPIIALAIYGLLRNRKPYWMFMAGAFVALSLGPRLHVLGEPVSASRLPYVALEAMPFLSASGVPGRYALPASVSIIMIASAGLAHLMRRFRSRQLAIGILAVLSVVVISYPPLVFYDPPRPSFMQLIRDDPTEGKVLPICRIDTALWLQTLHGKKMFGGLVSRVPPATQRFVRTTPVISEIFYGRELKISREEALASLRELDLRWVIVADEQSQGSDKGPRRTLEQDLGLAPVAHEKNIYLYRVE